MAVLANGGWGDGADSNDIKKFGLLSLFLFQADDFTLGILRDRRGGTTACPAYRAMGIKEVKKIVLGRLEQKRQDKILLYRHAEPNEPSK
jgi:hypothetical protein